MAAPTILLVVVDDLGRTDLGYTGSQIATPTIDALRAKGCELTSYYVQRACSPSRAALMTGRYPTRYGFQSGVLEPLKPYGLSLGETLLPARLKALGYATRARIAFTLRMAASLLTQPCSPRVRLDMASLSHCAWLRAC